MLKRLNLMQTITYDDGKAFVDGVVGGMVDRDEHVLLVTEPSRAALDSVAVRLAALRSRVLRPSGADALTLPGLLAQIVGRASGETLTAPDLERGFELLTEAGSDSDRIVLLVDRADALDPAALRYIQMLIRDAPLRLLLVGGPRLYKLLMQDEFGALRRGLVTYAAKAPAVADIPPPLPAVALPVLWTGKPAQRGRWVLARASMAVSLIGGLWLVHSGVLAG